MIKVLHITSSLKVGGAESLLAQLVPCLQKDIENFVIYFHEGPNSEILKNSGVKTFRSWGFFYKYDLFFFIKFFRLIKKIKPDYIHTHLWFANVIGCLAGKLFGIPVINTIHLVSTVETRASMGKFRYLLDKLTFKAAKQIILVGQNMKVNFQNNYAFVPAEKIFVIPNCINSELVREQGFKEQVSKESLGIDKKTFVFGCVGRLIPRKNYASLIKLFSQVNNSSFDCSLLIIGSGPEEEKLKILIKKLNIEDKVKIISANSAYKFYPIMDAYITVSFEEGLSIALLEALSFGLPIILQSHNKEHELVIDGQNGLIKKTDEEIVLAMRIFLEDFMLIKSFGDYSKKFVEEKYSLNCLVENYKNIYK